MRIEIFPDRCIGVGQCVVAAPDFFEQSEEDGIAYLLREDIATDRREAVLNAARLCPTLAIVVRED
jgi:ferredoxin